MATTFLVDGPRIVFVYKGKAGRTITDENVKEFWKKNKDLAGRRGCYVFGIRASKGSTPAYVGKATRSFKHEVFAHHKLTRYQQFLADYQKGTPVLFFVVAPAKKRGLPTVRTSGSLKTSSFRPALLLTRICSTSRAQRLRNGELLEYCVAARGSHQPLRGRSRRQ